MRKIRLRWITIGLAVVLLALLAVTALAAPAAPGAGYTLDWWTVDGGGGPATGAGYSLDGTAGQPDAGPALSGGGYALTGGFWTVHQRAVFLPVMRR